MCVCLHNNGDINSIFAYSAAVPRLLDMRRYMAILLCCLLSLILLVLSLARMRAVALKSRSNSYINYANSNNNNCHKEHGNFSAQLPIAVALFLLPQATATRASTLNCRHRRNNNNWFNFFAGAATLQTSNRCNFHAYDGRFWKIVARFSPSLAFRRYCHLKRWRAFLYFTVCVCVCASARNFLFTIGAWSV